MVMEHIKQASDCVTEEKTELKANLCLWLTYDVERAVLPTYFVLQNFCYLLYVFFLIYIFSEYLVLNAKLMLFIPLLSWVQSLHLK